MGFPPTWDCLCHTNKSCRKCSNREDCKEEDEEKREAVVKRSYHDLLEDFLYDNYNKTQNVDVEHGYIEFTKHFKYLGLSVFYNLQNGYDISQQLIKALQNMGMLKKLWNDQHVDLYSNHLFFLAIPLNQLLWGFEKWALSE